MARGRRRKANEILLACPRISPEWELAALKALIKPQTKDSILHRTGEQQIPGAIAEQIRRLIEAFGERTLFRPEIHWPMQGDYCFAASVSVADVDLARALSVAISRLRPELWLTCGRLLIHDGRFFRRRRGVRLELVEATDVRIPRELRALLDDLQDGQNSK